MSNVVTACRSCLHRELAPILTLGRTPLANALLTSAQLAEPEAAFPLDLAFCPECSLVQITETVPPEKMFRDYFYFSSFSDTMVSHARELTGRLVELRHLNPQSLVVEIASNDGYLLQFYRGQDVPVLGIEPATNVAEVAREQRGIPTLCEFFGRELAERLRESQQRADVIHANNVLAHVPDLNGFVAGLAILLKKDGVAVIEAPYVKDMIDHVEFDTIYHEHLCYFSLTALDRLVRRHGLKLTRVERINIHGGSLRLFITHAGEVPGMLTEDGSVQKLLTEERDWGVGRLSFYASFAARVEELKRNLCALLKGKQGEGKRIAAYGASAKGSTLLNYFGIGRETLDFVADRSSVKQGHFAPGSRLPIVAPEKLLEAMPDYVLLLTWNFRDEILEQQAEYRRRGGRFIIPIPALEVV